MNSAIETQTRAPKPAAPLPLLNKDIFRYGLALVSVAVATALGVLAAALDLHESIFTFFVLAVALTSWYAGVWPAIVAFLFGALSFNFFFTPPLHTFGVTREDLTYLSVFALFTALLIWFGIVRRQVEAELRNSRDELEQKVIERTADLQASERKYRELIDASPDAIFVWDAHGKCVLSNASAARLCGRSENELIGLSIADTHAPTERDRIRERFDRAKKEGVLRFERRFLRKNNEVVPVEVSLSTAGEDQYQAVLRDISERKRAEELLRERASLLDLTHDTVFVRNMNDVITYWNRGAEELYGWKAEEAVGQVTHQLTRTIFPEPLDEINKKLLRTGRWEGELIHTTRDGTQVVVASRWSLQRDERGNPIAILETNNNITERKQAEEALRRSRDELEIKVTERTAELRKANDDLHSVNRELEAFAYSVSHDLRAPVRHIAGFTELLQRHSGPVLDDKSRHHIDMILDSANRMGSLVDDLLAFSRIGRAETQRTTVNLEQLVKGVVGEIAPDTQGRRITWRVGTLPICYGDPSLLRLVFSNLVSNAVKFTRTRSEAEIEIGSLNHKPNEIVVFVKDNGVGFDMKYKDKLFGVFQRLHAQEAFEGTGIGLATVQRIVHRHGGKVWPESSVDHGATFYVALPKSGMEMLQPGESQGASVRRKV